MNGPFGVMNCAKHEAISPVQRCQGGDLDARYLAFFECFNRQHFFEAHEVLEELWLLRRGSSRALFYQGLIQLAGAFVHIQKRRFPPAMALLERARAKLRPYAPVFDRLEVHVLLPQIDHWIERAGNEDHAGLLPPGEAPAIELMGS